MCTVVITYFTIVICNGLLNAWMVSISYCKSSELKLATLQEMRNPAESVSNNDVCRHENAIIMFYTKKT